MTVSELIEELKKCPQDMEVLICAPEDSFVLDDVEKVVNERNFSGYNEYGKPIYRESIVIR